MSIIFIIDDQLENMRVLSDMLKQQEYNVRGAPDGPTALRMINTVLPDLILLDIRMPVMDGYEVCRRLKASWKTKDVPVIFISALGESLDKIRAFDVGGVDYITKPFQIEEVLARVRTHLSIRGMQKKFEEQNRELIKAARLREDIEQIARQDIKTPLTEIINIPGIMKDKYDFTREQLEDLKLIEDYGYKMLNMINMSLDSKR